MGCLYETLGRMWIEMYRALVQNANCDISIFAITDVYR